MSEDISLRIIRQIIRKHAMRIPRNRKEKIFKACLMAVHVTILDHLKDVDDSKQGMQYASYLWHSLSEPSNISANDRILLRRNVFLAMLVGGPTPEDIMSLSELPLENFSNVATGLYKQLIGH